VRFQINVQHDCVHGKCTVSGRKVRIQECQETSIEDPEFIHKDTEHWVINTHSFHNAHLLRTVLPRHLTAPVPVFMDHMAKHAEFAQTLRETQEAKRAEQKAQRENNPEGGTSKKRKKT
ncbi:hypothetical protein POSPLADRAFT_1142328, partial [Postia placenta MAD-698-R-SB12]